MKKDDQQAHVERVAQELWERGSLQIPGGSDAVVGSAVAVRDWSGGLHSWVVPLTIGAKLVAWAQFSPQYTLQRFSIFLRRETELNRCPNAADWLDPSVVEGRVREKAGPDVRLSTPILTFDRDPSRLVWATVVRDTSGSSQRWFVAGESVWQDPGIDEVTGGSASL
ncbi:MAG TPA: hypothetical protein VN708_10230 [Terriglobales bacterium]|nr:hypothetical protein [Terriglobales bacterium]